MLNTIRSQSLEMRRDDAAQYHVVPQRPLSGCEDTYARARIDTNAKLINKLSGRLYRVEAALQKASEASADIRPGGDDWGARRCH